MTATQLDLFGEVEAAETTAAAATTQRLVDGLTCLRDADPHTLNILLGTRHPHTGEVRASFSRPWAYATHRDAYHFEHERTWGGWYSTPAHHITWDELDALLQHDDRMHDLHAWDGYRYRPHELWPHPETWHPSYAERDHAAPDWPERRRVWQQLQDLLTDAMDTVTAGVRP